MSTINEVINEVVETNNTTTTATTTTTTTTTTPTITTTTTTTINPAIDTLQFIQQLFKDAVRIAFPDLNHTSQNFAVETPDLKWGDYQCNEAMSIFNKIKGKPGAPANPRQTAQEILKNLPQNEIISRTDIAGPGIINISLSTNWISNVVTDIVRNGVRAPSYQKKRVLIDFSSPNIAKEMHVGHLRSTILGETLCRVMEFCGHEVIRINHIGDWGTQFGMLITHLKTTFPDYFQNTPKISDLQQFYKQAKARFDADPEFKLLSQQEVVKLQSGDPVNIACWRTLCDVSLEEFYKIYQRLGVKITTRGESFYNELIPKIIKELEEKALITESDGAKCIFVEGQKIPLMVQKRDGGFSYDGTDLAALHHRIFESKADWILYVVDVGQSGHFDLVFNAGRMAGWYDPEKTRVEHVPFGLVCGSDGKKFKTRSGEVVKLVHLLDEGVERAKTGLVSRERGKELSENEMEAAALAIGYGAIKYADLSQNRLSNYVFSFDRMLDFKGNTAVYLLYAFARTSSICRRSGINIDDIRNEPIILQHASELALARMLLRWPQVILTVIDKLTPNTICSYLYDLISKFSAFVRDCRVIGDPLQNSRLLLCETLLLIQRKGLELLAIEPTTRI
eukprot:TRINITY_DN3133_c0_g1_i1.p1 TRINITY_DN3133_c0_g1~~TRINITY_DN3133_c0_g1_i1.p1  ORF type:complete len:622 (-),score=304.57 TRINITY_DN3133_c0_g1_i1:940-2805(-)